jgi:hypothetical protein
VAATAERLAQLLARRLDDRRWLVVFLDASQGVLFVIDGGKAMERAIRSVFGARALIQRCRQRHHDQGHADHHTQRS